MPRSGSTLVEQILASHPKVAGAGECKAFEPERFIPKRELKSMDRFIQLAVGAARVLEQSGVRIVT